MKTKLLLLLLFVFSLTQTTEAQWGPFGPVGSGNPIPIPPNAFVTMNIVSDFGAIPNDGINDHQAFEDAYLFFQNNYVGGTAGHGVLIIPSGTYDVGIQDMFLGGYYRSGHPVFTLTNASEFTIDGQLGHGPRPIIRYRACLRIGSFNPNDDGRYLGWPDDGMNPGFCNPLYLSYIGNCFEFIKSTSITIRNVELDGNIDEAKVGGYWSSGYRGIEGPNDGIFLNSTQGVTIENLNVHHFGQDGIDIESDQSVVMINTWINKTRVESNCRNGLSWRGGSDLRVTNSGFNLNGWGPFTSWTNAPNDPSGINISVTHGASDISLGNFSNINCIHNWGNGIYSVADPVHAYSFIFNTCVFVGSHEPNANNSTSWLTGWAAVPGLRLARWDNCRFYGNTVEPFADANFPNDGPDFNNCIFSDVYQNELYCVGDFGNPINRGWGAYGGKQRNFYVGNSSNAL